MDILTWDAETFYAKDYSLSKISTRAYVDDPRFELIGSAIKRNDEPTESFTGTYEETRHWLHSFDWANSALVAHNAVFDATILAWRFGIYPKLICDTLSMARAIHGTEVGGSLKALADHYGIGVKGTEVVLAIGKNRKDFTEEEMERYMAYCRNDVDLTYELFQILVQHFTKKELKLVDMTIRMHSEPKLSLDQKILEESLEEIRIKKEKALQECGVSKEDLMSNQKFAEVLKLLGVEPPMKTSPTTGKPTFAFAKKDEDLLALLDHDDIRVQTVVSARLQTKETLEETKTLRLIEVAERGDALPVGLKYYGAEVSGRWSAGGDNGALQLQNVARDSRIKEAIVAPLGYSIIGLDLSNIEVRVNLYLAGQGDQLDIIRSGLDMYRDFGNKVFNVPYDEITKAQRFISKTAVLGLGFGAGAKVLCKAINLGAKQYGFEVDVDEDEAKRIVGVYREINHLVKKAWYRGEEVLEAMRDDADYVYDPGFLPLSVRGSQGIHLPSGLYIKYPKLRQFANEDGKDEWTYEGRRNVKKRIYGPKVLQNCLSEGTLVLTNRGWTPIEEVTLNDYVHDGEAWVSHGGIVFQSVQSCITIDGVWMTPDHTVLTNEGWKTASQNPRPYRPDIRNVTSIMSRPQRWKKEILEVSMLLRRSFSEGWNEGATGGSEGRNPKLRMRYETAHIKREHETRNVFTSSLRGMGQHASALLQSTAPGLQELRRERHNGVRTVARVLRQLLGRHGDNLSTWVRARQERQQWSLLRRELRLGIKAAECNEPQSYTPYRYIDSIKIIGDRDNHPVQPPEIGVADGALAGYPRSPQQERKVYDILDCGVRQRFVVKGEKGPLIVHNCTQSVARCVIAEAMVRIGKKYPPSLTVHDSLYVVVPSEKAEEAYEFMMAEMTRPPKWAPDLPLAAEGGIGTNLKEAG